MLVLTLYVKNYLEDTYILWLYIFVNCDCKDRFFCLHQANERCNYDETLSLIGWGHTQNGTYECTEGTS